MIMRIMGEGQLEVPDDRLDELNELDDALADAISSGDETRSRRDLATLLDRVRLVATPVADDALAVSDLILPGPDSSLDEVRALLGEEGLIPG